MTGGLAGYVGVAHPWMCDTSGHVNTRHIMAMFDDASLQLLAHVAAGAAAGAAGWADVRCEIDYRGEIRAGEALTVSSTLERVGASSLTILHRLTGTVDGAVRAEARVVTVRFDLALRKSRTLDAEERRRAVALLEDRHAAEAPASMPAPASAPGEVEERNQP